MSSTKTLNRNPFNEKLIHRYLLELFYGIPEPQPGVLKKLLPKHLRRRKLNLVVPESKARGSQYRPDLTLYFRDLNESVPVEVKWRAELLKKDHQYDYLRKNGGILVALNTRDDLPDVYSTAIDRDHFKAWFIRNARRLWRDAEAQHLPERREPAHWLVAFRGADPKNNFEKMQATVTAGHAKRPFWAFKNTGLAIRNHLEVARGDDILFLFVSTAEANKAGPPREGSKLLRAGRERLITVEDWWSARVVTPYYMALEGHQSVFFEPGNPTVNERKWPHFIDFEVQDSSESAHANALPLTFRRGNLAEAFADSFNYGGGVPVPVDKASWFKLLGELGVVS